MKNSLKFIIAVCTFLLISSSINAQKKNVIPAEGFWVLESNVHNKKSTIIRFYTDKSVLIYEETVNNCRLNINRKKNVLDLNKGLEEAMVAWNNKKDVLKNGDMMAVLMKVKGRR
ncbi:MAG: hypothetical protein ABIW47_04620 [Ginsengibacter sp.]|jgi:hypothetical protein